MPDGKVYFTTDDVFVHCDDFESEKIDLWILLSSKHQKIINDNKQYDMKKFYYNMCIQMVMQVLGERTMANRISTVDVMYVNMLMPVVPLKELPNYLH